MKFIYHLLDDNQNLGIIIARKLQRRQQPRRLDTHRDNPIGNRIVIQIKYLCDFDDRAAACKKHKI